MTPDPLARFPVVVPLPVAWGDMDAFGHVNNVVYFRYFEAARIEYLTRVGWMASKETAGLGPIVHSTQARFRKALTYPDTVRVGGRVVEMRDDRVTIEHVLMSDRSAAVAAVGQVIVVNFDYRTGEKAALTDALRTAIRDLERPCGNELGSA
ncbi:MAG TPA: thioesterase family protein [Fimbriiglobus sp.]|jgi:acyl-CoA thioester hydrolase